MRQDDHSLDDQSSDGSGHGHNNAPQVVGVPHRLFLLGVLTIVALSVYGLLNIEHIPDPMPVHWNGRGEADNFVTRTPATVLGMVAVIPLVLLVIMWGCAALIRAQAMTPPTGWTAQERATAEQRGARTKATAHYSLRPFAGWSVALAVGLSLMLLCDIMGWLPGRWSLVLTIVGVLGITLGLLVSMMFAAEKARLEFPPSEGEPDIKWGVYYNNPDDKRTFIETAPGNYTVNLGHTAGRLVTAAMLAPLVLALLIPFLV